MNPIPAEEWLNLHHQEQTQRMRRPPLDSDPGQQPATNVGLVIPVANSRNPSPWPCRSTRGMYTIYPNTAPRNDVDALLDHVARVQSTQRAEDVDGFMSLFHPRAIWVNGAGTRLIGRDSIAEFTRGALPGGMGDGSVGYDVEHIEFISADIALTCVVQQYLDASGNPFDPASQGSPSYLWVRSSGNSWQIQSGQNTIVS
jgi:uncharacterized protein (TIGR02246 family)